MRCSCCGKVIKAGEYYYKFEDDEVCSGCIEDYLDDIALDHRVICEEEVVEEGDPRYEPEYWEDR